MKFIASEYKCEREYSTNRIEYSVNSVVGFVIKLVTENEMKNL